MEFFIKFYGGFYGLWEWEHFYEGNHMELEGVLDVSLGLTFWSDFEELVTRALIFDWERYQSFDGISEELKIGREHLQYLKALQNTFKCPK